MIVTHHGAQLTDKVLSYGCVLRLAVYWLGVLVIGSCRTKVLDLFVY